MSILDSLLVRQLSLNVYCVVMHMNKRIVLSYLFLYITKIVYTSIFCTEIDVCDCELRSHIIHTSPASFMHYWSNLGTQAPPLPGPECVLNSRAWWASKSTLSEDEAENWSFKATSLLNNPNSSSHTAGEEKHVLGLVSKRFLSCIAFFNLDSVHLFFTAYQFFRKLPYGIYCWWLGVLFCY